MRPAERFEAAVPLQRVDRTPVAPMIFFFAARHAGSSMETLVHDGKAAFAAIRRTFEDLGGWGVMPVPFGQADFPFLKRMVDELSARGIVSVLHFDSDWTGNLDYFQELPRASCILQLGGHLCLMGDVPAGLLAFGQPGEVAAQCNRLQDEMGTGGGFILGSGCEVPANARWENVKVMVDTGRKQR